MSQLKIQLFAQPLIRHKQLNAIEQKLLEKEKEVIKKNNYKKLTFFLAEIFVCKIKPGTRNSFKN